MDLRVDQNAAAEISPAAAESLAKEAVGTAAAVPPAATAASPERRINLRPLASLLPYIVSYRGRALAALGALVVAALTTLIVPIAIRRMIDFGFTAKGVALIDSYFLVMIGVAGVLAIASALRSCGSRLAGWPPTERVSVVERIRSWTNPATVECHRRRVRVCAL